jgi:hypothetical protein
LNTGHTFETMTDTMDITRVHTHTHTHTKGKRLNTLKKYHINKISDNELHMNNTNIDTDNPVFRTLQKMNIS